MRPTYLGRTAVSVFAPALLAFAADRLHLLPLSENESGVAATSTTFRSNQDNNAFFRSLGTNGRACVDCHQASTGWSIAPAQIRPLFDRTDGRDPLFRLNG